MRPNFRMSLIGAASALAVCLSTAVIAQNTPTERPPETQTRPQPEQNSGATRSQTQSNDTERSRANRAAWDHQHRVSKIIGTDVYNLQGDKLGDVKDIVLDKRGNVAYAIVSTGGFIGIGDTLHAVPWNSLDKRARENAYVMDMDKARLVSAPSFKDNAWPNFEDDRWVNENRRAFSPRS